MQADDINGEARILVQRHGRDAINVANARIAIAEFRGNAEDAALWHQIREAAVALLKDAS
jgi:hypothetical protein